MAERPPLPLWAPTSESAPVPDYLPRKGVVVASYLLMVAALLLVMWRGLLPGLLCACLGFLLTRRLTSWFDLGAKKIIQPRPVSAGNLKFAQIGAAAVVMLVPLALLAAGLTHSRGYLVNAPLQYQELLNYMARTVLELRLKLPPDMAAHLPEGVADIQRSIAAYLGAKAGALAMAGRAWLGGVLFAYVGLLIGALAAIRPPRATSGPLAQQLKLRIALFGDAFRQIVAAQFWIAAFNTLLTAIFLLFLLPLWDLRLPYTPMLITFTFVVGLVPIVGNLLCNVVMTALQIRLPTIGISPPKKVSMINAPL